MKFIPSDPTLLGELKERVSNKYDLEHAGVLALDGRLDSVEALFLYHVDLKSVHPSIVNSVARKVKTKIGLYHVEGLCWSMLENIKCKKLWLMSTQIVPSLPSPTSQNIVDCEDMDLDELYLSYVDLKSVHPSLVNSVAKKVKNVIRLDNVKGLCWSMLENVKCKSLCLVNTVPSLRSSTSQNIVVCEDMDLDELDLIHVDLKSVHPSILNSVAKKVKNKIRLNYVRGLCWSMLENVKCKSLCLEYTQTVPSLPASISQNIFECEDVTLTGPWGDDEDLISGLDVITCKRLRIHNRKLNDAQTKSLTKMLSNRVEKLVISCVDDNDMETKYENLLDYSLLANYDGQGSCKEMIFETEDCGDFYLKTINEHLGPWAKAVNWKFTQVDEREIIIKR